jgi:hypothetical protein
MALATQWQKGVTCGSHSIAKPQVSDSRWTKFDHRSPKINSNDDKSSVISRSTSTQQVRENAANQGCPSLSQDPPNTPLPLIVWGGLLTSEYFKLMALATQWQEGVTCGSHCVAKPQVSNSRWRKFDHRSPKINSNDDKIFCHQQKYPHTTSEGKRSKPRMPVPLPRSPQHSSTSNCVGGLAGICRGQHVPT